MNAEFEKYLDTIDRCLRPLPASERVDIVKEIKGSIIEMENEHLSAEQILKRLGNPKDLARAYLGDLVAGETGVSAKRILALCAFYGVVGFSGMVVIPTLGIIAPVCVLCGVFVPILGIIRLIDHLLNLHIPYMQYVGVSIGNMVLSPFPNFVVSIITGIALYLIGCASWKGLVFYCKKVSKTKQELFVR
uniref:HAAS signaling domain-containing protein n=1 Tax=Agathobacter sp. TaxID=2021311 RepID=UPI00405640B0